MRIQSLYVANRPLQVCGHAFLLDEDGVAEVPPELEEKVADFVSRMPDCIAVLKGDDEPLEQRSMLEEPVYSEVAPPPAPEEDDAPPPEVEGDVCPLTKKEIVARLEAAGVELPPVREHTKNLLITIAENNGVSLEPAESEEQE